MNNILTQNDGNNQLGIGSSQINLVGVANDSFDITQGTTSFMSFSTVSGSRKISVKKPITLNNNLLTIKSTAKIDSAPTNSLFYIGDNNELKTLGIGTTDEYLRMGFNRPAWGPKTFVETNISGIGNIGYLEELKIDDDKLIGIGSTLGYNTKDDVEKIITYDTNKHTSLRMSNGVSVGTLTIKTKYDTNFFNITLKKTDSDFSSNAISKSLEIVDAKTYKYTINDLSDNSIHYYKLSIDDINSFTTSTKKFHHITLRRDSTGPVFSSVSPGNNSYINSANIGYTISEALTSGTVKFIRTSGNASSNFTVNLVGSELNSGTHSSGALTNAPTLVSGTIYRIEFDGIDLAGNDASTVSVTGITYDTTAPSITSGPSISSSNSDSTLATSSDTVTLTFTTSKTIATPTISINGQTPSISNPSGNTWTAIYSPQASHNDGLISYNIVYQDLAGNSVNTGNVNSTIAHFETDNLRYYMWKQNHSDFSGFRGIKGYSWIQTQRHDSRTKSLENPATDKNNFLYYETGSTSDISGIVSGSSAGTNNLLYAGNWRDPTYHGRWGFVYDDNTAVVDEHIWQFEYKGTDTYGDYYHIINTQVQHNYDGSSWQGSNHQIGNCLGSNNSTAANNTSMRATTSNGGEWYCYVNHVSGTKFTIKIYNNGSAPTHELYMYVSSTSYSYERMTWKNGSNYTVSSSDSENNMQNNFTIKFNITHLGYAEPNPNPFAMSDLRFHMWNQNMQTSSETRGYVGYVNISCEINSKTFYLTNLGGSSSAYLYFTTDPVNSNLSHWGVGSSGGGEGDEHTFKITYNSGNNNYTIIPDNNSWNSSTTPFKQDIAIYILYYPEGTNADGSGKGSSLSTYPNWTGTFDITQVSGTTNKWNIYEDGTSNPFLFAQKDQGVYTVDWEYGYAGMHDSTRDKANYYYHMDQTNTDQAIFTFI